MSSSISVVSPRWLHLSTGLWHAIVLESGSPPRRGQLPKSSRSPRKVEAFLNTIRWRMSLRISEREFTAAYLQWISPPNQKQGNMIDLNVENARQLVCSLHTFRELLSNTGLSSADLSLMLGLIVNERNRLDIQLSDKSRANPIAIASRLQIVQKLFFCLDSTGGGTLGLDDMICLCLCEWATDCTELNNSQEEKSGLQAVENASIIMRSLGASTTSPGLATVTISQFQIGVATESAEDLGLTMRKLETYWRQSKHEFLEELHENPGKASSLSISQWRACWNLENLEASQDTEGDITSAWTDTSLPQVWQAANQIELAEKVTFIEKNITDSLDCEREVDRSVLVASFLELHGPPCRLVAYFDTASSVSSANNQTLRAQWNENVSTSLKEQYTTLACSGGLMQLFHQCDGKYRDITSRLRKFSTSWQPSKGELKQIERVVNRSAILLQETVSLLTEYLIKPRLQNNKVEIKKSEKENTTAESKVKHRETESNSVCTKKESRSLSGNVEFSHPETSPITANQVNHRTTTKKDTTVTSSSQTAEIRKRGLDENVLESNASLKVTSDPLTVSKQQVDDSASAPNSSGTTSKQQDDDTASNTSFSTESSSATNLTQVKQGTKKGMGHDLLSPPTVPVKSSYLSRSKVAAISFELYRRHQAINLLMAEICKRSKKEKLQLKDLKHPLPSNSSQNRILMDWEIFEEKITRAWLSTSDTVKSHYLFMALSNQLSVIQCTKTSTDPLDVANSLDCRIGDVSTPWSEGMSHCVVSGTFTQQDFREKLDIDLSSLEWEPVTLDDVVSDIIKAEEVGTSSIVADNDWLSNRLSSKGALSPLQTVFPPGLKHIAALSLFLKRSSDVLVSDVLCRIICETVDKLLIRSGYLHKRASNLFRNWKTKYFELGTSSNELVVQSTHGAVLSSFSLYYYKTSNDGTISGAKREYSLVDAAVSVPEESSSNDEFDGRFFFKTPLAELELKCDSEEGFEAWVSQIAFACAVQSSILDLDQSATNLADGLASAVQEAVNTNPLPPVPALQYHTPGVQAAQAALESEGEASNAPKDAQSQEPSVEGTVDPEKKSSPELATRNGAQMRRKADPKGSRGANTTQSSSTTDTLTKHEIENEALQENDALENEKNFISDVGTKLEQEAVPGVGTEVKPNEKQLLVGLYKSAKGSQQATPHATSENTSSASEIQDLHPSSMLDSSTTADTSPGPQAGFASSLKAPFNVRSHSLPSTHATPYWRKAGHEAAMRSKTEESRTRATSNQVVDVGKKLEELASIAENLRIAAEAQRQVSSPVKEEVRYHHRSTTRKPTSPSISARSTNRMHNGGRHVPSTFSFPHAPGKRLGRLAVSNKRVSNRWQHNGDEDEAGLWNLELNFARHELQHPVSSKLNRSSSPRHLNNN